MQAVRSLFTCSLHVLGSDTGAACQRVSRLQRQLVADLDLAAEERRGKCLKTLVQLADLVGSEFVAIFIATFNTEKNLSPFSLLFLLTERDSI